MVEFRLKLEKSLKKKPKVYALMRQAQEAADKQLAHKKANR